jgi:hypothetical protein
MEGTETRRGSRSEVGEGEREEGRRGVEQVK